MGDHKSMPHFVDTLIVKGTVAAVDSTLWLDELADRLLVDRLNRHWWIRYWRVSHWGLSHWRLSHWRICNLGIRNWGISSFLKKVMNQ